MKHITEHVDTDRYHFDFGKCSCSKGWAQMDTNQDAHYFGIWTNPSKRAVFCYCEGDCDFRSFDTDAEYVAEVRRVVAYYNDDGRFIGIDPGFNDALKASLERFGFADLLH